VAVAAATVAVSLLLIGGATQASDAVWLEVAAGVGTFVLVLLRRRWPLPLLALALTWAAVYVLVWERPSSLMFAAPVLLATACVQLDRGPAIALGTAVGLALYGFALTVNAELDPLDGRAALELADRYAKARRRVQVLTVATVITSTIAVGALVWGAGQPITAGTRCSPREP
jgi:hypothetical protein